MAPIPDKTPAPPTKPLGRLTSPEQSVRVTLTPSEPLEKFTSGTYFDSDVQQYSRFAQESGYPHYRGRNVEGVPVYRDEASRVLPQGWKKETQSNGVNAYSDGNLELKVTVRKRRRRRVENREAPQPKPQSKKPQLQKPPSSGKVVPGVAPTREQKTTQKATPVEDAKKPTDEIYIHPYIRENSDLIKTVAERHGIPPEMLGATIATELRGGETARQYQKEKNIPAAIWNVLKGEGIGSTSLGPGQVSVNASLESGVESTPGQEFLRLHLSDTYAVDRAGAYLKHLFAKNYSARSADKTIVHPLHYSDRDWARVISGYNTGDVTTARGTYHDQLYTEGPYSQDIQRRIKACRKILEEE